MCSRSRRKQNRRQHLAFTRTNYDRAFEYNLLPMAKPVTPSGRRSAAWLQFIAGAASLATAAVLLLAGCAALKRMQANPNIGGSSIHWDPTNGLKGTIHVAPDPLPTPSPPPPEATAIPVWTPNSEVALENRGAP